MRPASIFVFLWLHWVLPCCTLRLSGTDAVSALDEGLFEKPDDGASAVKPLAAEEDGRASVLIESADKASAAEAWGLTDLRNFGKKAEEEAETGKFNQGVVSRMFRAMGQKEGEASCADPLLATVTINRSQWEYIADNSHKYFLARARKEWKSTSSLVLHSTGRLWDELATPVGALPVVAGFKLYAVDGRWEITWTWSKLLEVVSFNERPDKTESVVLSFLAGYDFRSCWGNTVDQIHQHHVCGPEPLGMLASDLEHGAVAQFDPAHKAWRVHRNAEKQPLANFVVQEMSQDDLMLLRKVAPELQADGDARLEAQEGMCYRSALAPICVVLQLPSVCRGESDGCHKEEDNGLDDVFWMAQRRVELPEQSLQGMKIDDQSAKIKEMELQGPQVSRSIHDFRHALTRESKWHKKDQGFMTLFPMGLNIASCGSREASLALQLDTMSLAHTNMTGYTMQARFYKQEETHECACQVGNKTFWPLIMDAHRPKTQESFRLVVGVTDWLKQDVRRWYQMSSPKTRPDVYRDNFMRMFPHYFHLETRELEKLDLDANETKMLDENATKYRVVLKKSFAEPSEYMEKGMKVRALEKIKYKSGLFCSDRSGIGWMEWAYNIIAEDCKGEINITNVTTGQDMITEFFLKQMPQENSWSSPSRSKYKILPGQTGEIIDIVWPETEGIGKPMVVVRWDHIQGTERRKILCENAEFMDCWIPAPVFNVRPNQMMALNRTIVRTLEVEVPEPEPAPREPEGEAKGTLETLLPFLINFAKLIAGGTLIAGIVGCLCMFNETVEVVGNPHRRQTAGQMHMREAVSGVSGFTAVTALPAPAVHLTGTTVGMQPRLGEQGVSGFFVGDQWRQAPPGGRTVSQAIAEMDWDDLDEFEGEDEDQPRLRTGPSARLEAPARDGAGSRGLEF